MSPAQLTREVTELKDQLTGSEETYAAHNENIDVSYNALTQHGDKLTHHDDRRPSYHVYLNTMRVKFETFFIFMQNSSGRGC